MKQHWTVIVPVILTVIGVLLLLPSFAQLVVASVTRIPESSPLGLTTPPWTNGETVEYRIQSFSGTYVGYARYAFAKKGSMWTIRYDCDTARLEEHSVLELKGDSLKPLREEKQLSTAQGAAKVEATYVDNIVNVSGTFWQLGQTAKNAEPKKTTMSIQNDAYDNDQVLMSLRALPFAEGYQSRYTNIVPANATQWPSTIKVLGKDNITTPLGNIDTWKMEIDFGSTQHMVWYQIAEPHQMIKYDNNDTLFLIDSVKR